MEILSEMPYEKQVPKNAIFNVFIDNEKVLNYKIKQEGKINRILIFGNLFEKYEDFCIGAIFGTNKAICNFKERNI